MRTTLLILLLLASLAGRGFSQGTPQTIAITGDIAPGSGGGTYWVFDQLSLNNNGELAFIGGMHGGTVESAIYRYASSTITPVVQNNDPTPAGGRYFYFNLPLLRDSGEIVFDAAMLDTPVGQGIFRTENGPVSFALGYGSAAPGGGTFTQVNLSSVNNNGQFVFSSSVSDRNGIYRHDGATITKLVQADDATPVGGTFKTIGTNQGLSDSGETVFNASYENGGLNSGIFRTDGTKTSAIAVKGNATPFGGTWRGFGQATINAGGDTAFVASLTGGPTDVGIFVQSGAIITPFVLHGDNVPGLPGVTFTGPMGFVFNDQGQFALVATLQGVGVDGNNDTAIFVGSSLSNLVMIAREGGTMRIGGTDRTLVGDAFITSLALNGNSLAWVANFDGGSALMLSPTASAPEPASLALITLGVIGGVFWNRRQSS